MANLATVHESYQHGLRPDALLSVSEWADLYRYLDTGTSGFPGRWKTSRTPYLREPMDRLSPTDPCTFVVCMFASQLGKTEIGLNWHGRNIHHSPGPMLLVQPTVEMAERYSKQRITGMIKSTPVLKGLVSDSKSRDGANTIMSKSFPGGMMIFAGGNSSAGLSSMPARDVDLDEVDRISDEAGGEGDTADQAIQRTAGFPNRKVLLTSTPTFKGASRIEEWFLLGDQRRYWVPCPHCGEFQTLKWSGVTWDKGKPETAHYVCEHNGCVIENRHKAKMLPLGEWRADKPDTDGKIRSYHLNALYTPHGWPNDFAELARLFLLAQKNPIKLKAFVNLKLAETWDPFATGGISHDYLLNRSAQGAEEFGNWSDERGHEHEAPVPDECLVLTCAVDVQADRLEVETTGWGIGEEKWSIDYRRIPGDLSSPQPWEELDRYLAREWSTESGWTMRLSRSVIDSGGHFTQQVYDFVRDKRSRYIYAIKGQAGSRPIWNPKPSTSAKSRGAFYLVGVDAAKELIYARLKLDTPGPGFTHYPRGRSEDYFKSLVAERQEKVFHAGQPRIRWICPPRTPNEGLDLAVYNYAAFKSWSMAGNSMERLAATRAKAKAGVDDPAARVQGSNKRPSKAPRKAHWLDGGPAT
jgi:phage terminase large subunit GpA-like protein